jgi:murein DD-endopeptidase MepM/ murein hydrolase activator NlpD
MRRIFLWILMPVILVTAYHSAKAPEAETPLPNIPDTSGPIETSIIVIPETVRQGEPVRIVIENIGTSTVESLRFNSKSLDVFTHEDKPSALVGIDLKATPGTYPIKLALSDGRRIEKDLVVGKRQIVTAPLGIPDNLGGNTPEAAQNLVTTLAEENAILAAVPTEKRKLWDGEFEYPLKGKIVVTDEYGYTRSTVNTSVSHKGTDFRATPGAPVYAMNSGKVVLAREFRNYGYTIVIDHGFGVQTLYMHLSVLEVREGDKVIRGQLIAKSGKTGYAEFPHLHISIKIGGVSIDPLKFLELF